MRDSTPSVLVVMAAYNGEKYIAEQVESILAQEGVDVTISIHDDQSQDGTLQALKCFEGNPRVQVCRNSERLGVGRNFMLPIWDGATPRYDYYAFSDQDDVWEPNKLQQAVSAINACPPHPMGRLYYSDYTNVDENLDNPRREKYLYKGCEHSFPTLLVRNWAPGCTMVFDHPLRELLMQHPLDDMPRIHDAWVHLVALSCAQVVPDLDRSYVLRRITGSNVAGQERFKWGSVADAFSSLQHFVRPSTHELSRTAALLLECYGSLMGEHDRAFAERVATLNSSPRSRFFLATTDEIMLPTRGASIRARMRLLFGRW